MYVHVIMHDLPHLPHRITAPMHQYMFMEYPCSWHSSNLKTLISIKEIKTNKTTKNIEVETSR